MPIVPSAHDDGSHPVQSLSGDAVCFGFLTYCLLLMVERLPPNNGGARVLDSVDTVDTVGDDAAIVASILTKWRILDRSQGSNAVSRYCIRRNQRILSQKSGAPADQRLEAFPRFPGAVLSPLADVLFHRVNPVDVVPPSVQQVTVPGPGPTPGVQSAIAWGQVNDSIQQVGIALLGIALQGRVGRIGVYRMGELVG